MIQFSCMVCLAAEADKRFQDEDGDYYACRSCMKKLTEDTLLDMVNEGLLRIDPPDGFVATAKWHEQHPA